MILVVGLGNPGAQYAETRHNVGYRIVDRLAERARSPAWREKFHGALVEIPLGGERALALKPATYMNDSGRSVRAAAAFYKVPAESVLVVHDELDLPFGEVRLKLGGGEAGHNGLKSVTRELGTQAYARLRIGVGKPPNDFHGTGADFVLEGFAPSERDAVGAIVDRAADAVALVVAQGLEAAMNVTNRRAND